MSIKAIICGSLRWSLYTGLNVVYQQAVMGKDIKSLIVMQIPKTFFRREGSAIENSVRE